MITINNSLKNETVENTTWLQGIGHTYGKKGSEIKIGDTLVWNYGTTSKVLKVLKETKAYITFLIDSSNSDDTFERRIKKDRIVAIEN